MDKLCATGVTLILVSHNTNDIERICDRAIWIDNGVIKFDGNVNKTISNYENTLKK